ncbi:NAD(P)H-quinone oxidoreductase subunit H [Gloeobacter violaceus]|uniref:NAD(P)H-quinone oxidoreductase subunit H 2 n=1 Tax=Gloeobacter violaceus (strain ATCC 29082 / PCC 7421) TaxID=251221 RepID=NDHH2_GLOVI|nr:NAD(P)H-quinone oxidoreductase subunit H [Gloeobacter violaceus]Q7NI01.1 RecName: Full=NAD(P)H-quinone oxidoreductase subunit H 2; AltName: Full=NAD(P)H dehydrogenase subunit H 2; AltName: Full=NADH-plastoquinone oxidoreductase subunit H 2; AltName: Full=NDH-1 subunit H 2; Short=NDH-H 2 [Gloeobacter violaceus PCC 7421]BAC90324.1 NADH dehydrogenase subunit 7 [Gloeobacter violaceus PCC 7421]
MVTIETRADQMVLNLGPHHPSTHGVLRLIVTLDGENVVDCRPVLGYLHRGMEKIGENRTIIQYLPYCSRWDYAAAMMNEAPVVNAPEAMAGVKVPRRASYIRVIMLELSRIANHLLWVGPFLLDMGAQSPFFYILRERELILDLFEAATGLRMVGNNYFRVGGVTVDLPYGWVDKAHDLCDVIPGKIDEYERLITNNPIFRRRIENLGYISREDAINWGLSGPMLRASGVKWDLRKVDHYEIYDELDWDIAWDTGGDCLARYIVRIKEMRESVKIIRQALDQLPGGPYEQLEARRLAEGPKSEWNSFDYQFIGKKSSPTFKIPTGEYYARSEEAKGELGIYVVGRDDTTPWRWKIRTPDFANLAILPMILQGTKVADLVVVLGSIDIIMGSVDR